MSSRPSLQYRMKFRLAISNKRFQGSSFPSCPTPEIRVGMTAPRHYRPSRIVSAGSSGGYRKYVTRARGQSPGLHPYARLTDYETIPSPVVGYVRRERHNPYPPVRRLILSDAQRLWTPDFVVGDRVACIDTPMLPPSETAVTSKTSYRQLGSYNEIYTDGHRPPVMYIPGNIVCPEEKKKDTSANIHQVHRPSSDHTPCPFPYHERSHQ